MFKYYLYSFFVITSVFLRSFMTIAEALLLLFSVMGCVMVLIVFVILQYAL